MTTFAELVASRKEWIEHTLKPWCAQARRIDLLLAEGEWTDIAGKAPADATLWTWAWGRFPQLVHDGLTGVDETSEVEVTLADGRTFTGYPDNRESTHGQLVLLGRGSSSGTKLELLGPFSIDDIASVRKA